MSTFKILREHTPTEHATLPWIECNCSPGDWFSSVMEWAEHLIEVTMEYAKTQSLCPRCGSFIPSDEHAGEYPGAISRWDNRTEICSDCGAREAMVTLTGGLITPVHQPLPPEEEMGG